MNKKLRLLVMTRCPDKCPMCCNNQFDFSKLPVVDRWNYEEIMITGGEPLLFMDELCELVEVINSISYIQGNRPNIYLYTSYFNEDCLMWMLGYIDGIVLTPHKKSDIANFVEFNSKLIACKDLMFLEGKSLRMNLFPDMKALLPKDIDLSLWQVKDMEWVENCPVPEGEDFRRIANLW